ncbi:hypothetical protein [Stenotrophomonas sp.]|uniref:hypothetical protein n=1 Tax=Stenotrophomonas sp. TaxID=69392 RepID=UPI0028A99704|nr:hypothetical protein [Stenotrophomonas sp.]
MTRHVICRDTSPVAGQGKGSDHQRQQQDAAERLLDLIHGRMVDAPMLDLGFELMVRESS